MPESRGRRTEVPNPLPGAEAREAMLRLADQVLRVRGKRHLVDRAAGAAVRRVVPEAVEQLAATMSRHPVPIVTMRLHREVIRRAIRHRTPRLIHRLTHHLRAQLRVQLLAPGGARAEREAAVQHEAAETS